VGLHAKPDDASILIFKGAPYPRLLLQFDRAQRYHPSTLVRTPEVYAVLRFYGSLFPGSAVLFSLVLRFTVPAN